MAARDALLGDMAAKHDRVLVAGRHGRAFADESAELGHLGDDHGNHFDGIDFLVGIAARLFRLDHQHAERFAEPLDRHAEEGGIGLFAGLRHVAKAARGGGVIGVDHLAGAGDAAHETFAEPHPRLVHGLGVETFGGAEFERFLVAEEIDRADLGAHFF